jgi:glucokinase
MGVVNKKWRHLQNSFTLGVDLGGTKVVTGLVDANGLILSVHRYPTHPEMGTSKIFEDIVASVDGCLRKAGVKACALGIGVAGQVDSTGVVCFAPDLPLRDEPLRARLEKKLGMRVVVTNDVRAATYGEWYHGARKGVDDLVAIFVGTRTGGGIVSDGRLLHGYSNMLGELGHITIVEGGRQCRYRNLGCLEAYIGGWAIAKRAREAVSARPKEGERLKSWGVSRKYNGSYCESGLP